MACICLLTGSSPLHSTTDPSIVRKFSVSVVPTQGRLPGSAGLVTGGSGSAYFEILLKMLFLCFVLFRNFPNFYQVKDTTTRMCSLGGQLA